MLRRPVESADGWELLNGSVSQWEAGRSVYMIGFYTYRRCAENRDSVEASVTQTPMARTVSEANVPSEQVNLAEASFPARACPVDHVVGCRSQMRMAAMSMVPRQTKSRLS